MKKLDNDQRGIASIIISITIVVVVSLIVLGFASLMRRERRQALDQQQSTQASLAAESALNEKVAAIRANPTSVAAETNCNPTDVFSDNNNERSTCLLVNPAPDTLEYDEVRTDASTIVYLRPESGKLLRSVIISWERASVGGGNCSSSAYTNLPTSRGTNDIGFLRMDMTRVGTDFSRAGLTANTFSAVLYPRTSGTVANNFSGNPGNNTTPAIYGSCGSATYSTSTPLYTAKAQVEFPPSPGEAGPLLLRLRGIYKPSQVRIIGIATDNSEVRFEGAQVIIDSTAKVNDVVRRVQARVPISTVPGDYADFAVRSTDSLCKLLQTEPGSATVIEACP
jgi:Tfp pilus assembly protein PilV